jgi:hypothetical protein
MENPDLRKALGMAVRPAARCAVPADSCNRARERLGQSQTAGTKAAVCSIRDGGHNPMPPTPA